MSDLCPRFFITKTKNTREQIYFIGAQYREMCNIVYSERKRRQIRIGLIWWQAGVTFNW